MKSKAAMFGFAQCRRSCPAGWLCETRTADGCGPAPLGQVAPVPTDAAPLLSPASACARHSPPPSNATFEVTCYDGGATGNRYVMLKNALRRAVCCAGVLLLPPSFDGFAETGASCFDFTALRARASKSKACVGIAASSKHWWARLNKATPSACADDLPLARAAAALNAGVGVARNNERDLPGRALGRPCNSTLQAALVVQVRSGDIFRDLHDGERTAHHAGFQADLHGRGQPPLAFYLRALAHGYQSVAGAPSKPFEEMVVVTSPDRLNPVVRALQRARLRVPVRVSSSDDFSQDLSTLLCARHLAAAASSTLTTRGGIVRDSPHVRTLFRFEGECATAGRPAGQRQARPCDRTPGSLAPVLEWCAAPRSPYSVHQRWNNSRSQQEEMLTYSDVSELVLACVP